MVHATSLKRFSAVSVALGLLGLGAIEARAQDTDPLARVNQDELASFYGRMNVVVGSGARAFGMGGAFLARADDATAASWNPAGLSYLRRTEFSLVGVHNDFSQRVPRLNAVLENPGDSPLPVKTVDQLRGSVADFVGVAYPFRIKGKSGALQASYQRSFSFTGSRRSEGPVGVKGFVDGRKIQPTEFTVEGKGGFDTVSLSSGFEVHPRLRLGVSVNWWINGFSQLVDRPNAQTGGYRRIESTWDISGTNFNVGGLITPTPKLNLGVVYKTPFAARVRLTKVREDLTTAALDPLTNLRPVPDVNRRSGDVTLRFPRVYGLGASYRPSNTLTFSADFTRTAWSRATITNFFSLARRPASSDGGLVNGVDPYVDIYGDRPFPAVEVPATAEGVFRQVDTGQVRTGVEWVLRLGQSGGLLIPLRAGFFRDGQPVIIKLKDAGRPEADGIETQPSFSGFTAGFGVTVGGVLFDVAYIREGGDVPASRKADGVDLKDPDGKRNIRYNRLFASVMLRFGQRH
jgi:hypothetical protein